MNLVDMPEKKLIKYIDFNMTTPAVQKGRHNETCQMDAWYYQTENNTFAFARLKGEHGERKDIPADRKYFIFAGSGVFTINGKEHQVAKGSIVEIPALTTYNFHAVGDEELEFFVDVGVRLELDKIPSN